MSNQQLVDLLDAGRPAERADAAANRLRVLAAAERLFAERGACNVSMDDVAQAAGVGKGTVYRRFGDQAGLALALLEERERRLQEQLVRGDPPLGPGAPPRERLTAFLDALVDLLDAHTELHVLSETAARGARYASGLYAFYRLHTRILLAEADAGIDVEWFADALLAPLAAELFRHQREELGMDVDRIKEGLHALADAILGGGS